MKVLLTGAEGQLGKNIKSKFSNCIALGHGTSTDKIEFEDSDNIENTLSRFDPEIIINTAAFTNVDLCESNKRQAMAINGNALRQITNFSRKNGVYLIHISTDYVFDGFKGNYNESDVPYPINFYGVSKLIGDVYVSSYDNSLVIRTSGIFGSKSNFPAFVLKRLKNGENVPAMQSFYSPISAKMLSVGIKEAINLKVKGILNIAGERISRQEFAVKIAKYFNFEENLIKALKQEDLNFKAKRPYDSSLDIGQAKKLLSKEVFDSELNISTLSDYALSE